MCAAGTVLHKGPQLGRGNASYRLEEAGEQLLGASEQYPTISFKLTGNDLNALISVARLSQKAVAEPVGDAKPPQPERKNEIPSPTTERVLAEFERLRREQFSEHGMVPIYVLRQAVAKLFGQAAAAHDTLDPLLHELRRQRRIRLVALGNAGDRTEQQLADSIPGENEIYFAIEAAHEHAVVS